MADPSNDGLKLPHDVVLVVPTDDVEVIVPLEREEPVTVTVEREDPDPVLLVFEVDEET
jgi:hypothetical protein